MFKPQPDQSPTQKWAFTASLLLHFGVVITAALWVAPHTLSPSNSRPVNVEVMSRAQFEALAAPDAPKVSEPATEPPAPQTAISGDETFISAERFLASAILDDPDNAEVRRNLPRLAASEQVIQLCNIEGLEQLRLGGIDPAPDMLNGYAYHDMEIAGLALQADGGAYRSGGHWFHIRYRCAVSDDDTSVAGFEYALGPSIPENEWQAHNLNADDDWLN